MTNAILVIQYIAFYASLAVPTKKLNAKLNILASMLGLVWYTLCKQYSGLLQGVTAILRDSLVLKINKRHRHVVTAIVVTVATACYVMVWDGWATVLSMLVSYSGIYSKVYCQMKGIRIISLFRAIGWSAYMLVCGSILGAVLESVNIIVCIVALIHYKKGVRE